MFKVTVSERGANSVSYHFDKPEVTVGRVRGNDIVLKKSSVSKRHAKLLLKDGNFVVVDLKSTNGTVVNGRKIAAPQILRDSDRLVVGDYVLELQKMTNGDRPASPPTTPRDRAPADAEGVEAEAARPGITLEPMLAPEPVDTAAAPAVEPAFEVLSNEVPDAEVSSLGESWPTMQGDDFVDPAPQVPVSRSTVVMPTPRALQRDGTQSGEAGTISRSLPIVAARPGFRKALSEGARALLERVPMIDMPKQYPASDADVQRYKGIITEVLSGVSTPEGFDVGEVAPVLLDLATGLGPIEYFLDDPGVNAIHVNGPDAVYVQRGDAMEQMHAGFGARRMLMVVARRILASAEITDPLGGSVRLPDGTQIEIVMPPAAPRGPVITVKKAPREHRRTVDLIEDAWLSEEIAVALRLAMNFGGSVLVACEDRSQASVLLNALVGDLEPTKRLIAVESAPTLQLKSNAFVRLEHMPGTTPSALARALTLDPALLVIDPLSDDLVADWLLGASGRGCSTFATLSARNPNDALSRLLVMAVAPGTDATAMRRQIAANVDLLVHLRARRGGAQVAEVLEITGEDAGRLLTSTVFRSKNGPSGLEFGATGHVPALFAALSEAGEEFDGSIFNA